MEFSFAPILKKICREVAGIPNSTDVYLEDWWLSKPNGVKGISVSGCSVEKRRYDTHQRECDSAPNKWIGASREFHSTEVVKRHSSTTVETSNGLCVYLCGFINRSRTMENGFSSEVLRDFRYGFPFNWEDYTVESVAKESSQSYHDHFTETILPITLNTYNGAHLHDMVLSLTYAEREILNKKMYDNSMGTLNPETASGKSSKPNPPFVEEEIQLTPISSTAKVNNKRQLQTTPLNYDEHGQVGSRDPQRNHHQGGEEEAQEQPQLPPPYCYHHRTQPPPPFEEPFNHHHHNHLFHLEQPETVHQLRELYSQLEPHNLGPISEIQHPIKKRSYLPSSSSALPRTAHVRKKSAMGGGDSQPVSTRSALRKAGGEIVEVQGGHIVRATGRKDRHSKVCTAMGPRDRRVRLSANTAIQFYDVQDRLGYDRPSKAVDWLIKKAKNSIDELEQLPAWSPTNMNMSTTTTRRRGGGKSSNGDENGNEEAVGQQELFGGAHNQFQDYTSHSTILPPSLDSDSIADTIKSFFPMGGTGAVGPSTTSSASPQPHMQFQDYSQGSLLNHSGGGGGSSNCRQSQDLRLSLQSFQDPILLHSHHHHQAAARDSQKSLFPGAAPTGFENPNVRSTEHHQPNPDVGQLHRLVVGWNNEIGTDHNNASGIGGGSFMFNPPQILQPLFGGHHHHHSQLFTQRGPLQSSNTPAIRAWIVDPVVNSSTNNEQYHQTAISVHPQAFSGIGFSSGGFPGFQIPARIQGEEEHGGDPCKPSSASSGSCL